MDTITAISTPPGEGGIAVIRISGERSLCIADELFKGTKNPSALESHRVIHGEICDDGKPVDEVLLTVMKAPNSYTGEDVVEISCHGGRVVSGRILRLILAEGARQAGPGEFTLRAFLNGKIDLMQAEAVADIVSASSPVAQKNAYLLMRGGLSREIYKIKTSLEKSLILMEALINFPEDIDLNEDVLYEGIENVKKEVEGVLEGARYGRIMRGGMIIPIVGKTNVGKSTLFNCLLERERAIVTPIPGTTRDTIEGTVDMEGISVKFLDTCGIRKAKDVVETLGVERTRKAIEEGDIVLFVLDQSSTLSEDDRAFIPLLEGKDVIAVLNKCDIGNDNGFDIRFRKVSISARTGKNIDALLSTIKKKISPSKGDFFVSNERHIGILEGVRRCLSSALCGETIDMSAYDVTSAVHLLEKMGGDKKREVLDSIFSRFCIGK